MYLWVCQMMLLCFMRGMNGILIQKDILIWKLERSRIQSWCFRANSIIKTIQHLLEIFCISQNKKHITYVVLYYSEIYAGIEDHEGKMKNFIYVSRKFIGWFEKFSFWLLFGFQKVFFWVCVCGWFDFLMIFGFWMVLRRKGVDVKIGKISYTLVVKEIEKKFFLFVGRNHFESSIFFLKRFWAYGKV